MDENTPLFITKKQFLTIWPHLEKARMRLLLRPILVDKKLDPYDDPFLEYFAPPSSPQDEKIMILADLAAGLLFNIHEQLEQVKISSLIRKALMEIDQAYEVMKNEGGGWGREANEKNRQSPVYSGPIRLTWLC